MTSNPLYLDYNATAPMLPQAKASVLEVMENACNASSVHAYGRQAKHVMESARQSVLRSMGAEGAELVFTGSGTEANNTVLRGTEAQQLLVSEVEHLSVLTPARTLGAKLIPVDKAGVVQLDVLENLLAGAKEVSLISVMLANNETGVLQPLKEIVALARRHRALVHSDLSQAYGKMPLDFYDLGVDFATLSSHKMGGPQGVGALVMKNGLSIKPLVEGGGQEKYRRAGTEPIALIAGFGEAAKHIRFCTPDVRDYMENTLATLQGDALCKALVERSRLPNTALVFMDRVSNQTQQMVFDLNGIMVSSGSACSSGKADVSHVLTAMGLPQARARTAVRVSFGPDSTRRDADRFIAVWKKLYDKKHKVNSNHKAFSDEGSTVFQASAG